MKLKGHYFCCDELRREAVRNHESLNGIDFLEVFDCETEKNIDDEPKCLLKVHLIKPLIADSILTDENLRIEGGDRIKNIAVKIQDKKANPLIVVASNSGDFSTYTFKITEKDSDRPLPGFDPRLYSIDFSFKANCRSDFDCRPENICPPEQMSHPEINYLAKDYASMRKLMLDRMSMLIPGWKERNAADHGVALIELLAYVGDYLSYRQDAIATEAYLGTARLKTSIRRHARLVDYFVHEGCNSRVWVQIQVDKDCQLDKGTQLLTRIDELANCISPPKPSSDPSYDQKAYLEYSRVMSQGPVVFETMRQSPLYEGLNGIKFYTWGDERCCLPKGAIRATLEDGPSILECKLEEKYIEYLMNHPKRRSRLRTGDVLIFQEVLGPNTGRPEDANPSRSHAVRLTRVYPEAKLVDKGTDREPSDPVIDPLKGQAYVEIEWSAEDALPFPFCLTTKVKKKESGVFEAVRDVSIALGNIVLADHGRTIPERSFPKEDLGKIPQPNPVLFKVRKQTSDRCKEKSSQITLPRFRPMLKERPLTYAATYDEKASANAAIHWVIYDALPSISLTTNPGGKTWLPKRDLLSSDADEEVFVVETEWNGSAYLRFGDGYHGSRPDSGTSFSARYRVGNGAHGNVGAHALAHIVSDVEGIIGITNPLPAQGGVEQEGLEHVRQSAPNAFKIQERAVTEEDYAEVAGRYPGVQRAAATFRWTGSWYTVFLTIDRWGSMDVDDEFKLQIRGHMERFRMAGHDLEINGPRYVPLEAEITVCVKPDYFQSDVEEELLQLLSSRILPDGSRGIFHPDNFTFGQPVYLSPIYAIAQAVDGVDHVIINPFHRKGLPSLEAIATGKLKMGPLEIACLDNDPNYPDRGTLRIHVEGGK
jgi:hypothetical protein